MIIRKLFKFEGAHIVRDCSSDRCKKSIHGHSYIVELFFESNSLDNGQMVVDFGLLKGSIRDIIDSFDHSYSLWDKEKNDFKEFITTHSDRYVIMPVSPTAEMYSLMFFAVIKHILDLTKFNNGEKNVELKSVRVHETDTGYAESNAYDYINIWMPTYNIKDIVFSEGITKEWKNPSMWDDVLTGNKELFINPKIERKYNI